MSVELVHSKLMSSVFVIVLSITMAFMLWVEIEWHPIVMIYALPAGLYIPVVSSIGLFMTFTQKVHSGEQLNRK